MIIEFVIIWSIVLLLLLILSLYFDGFFSRLKTIYIHLGEIIREYKILWKQEKIYNELQREYILNDKRYY